MNFNPFHHLVKWLRDKYQDSVFASNENEWRATQPKFDSMPASPLAIESSWGISGIARRYKFPESITKEEAFISNDLDYNHSANDYLALLNIFVAPYIKEEKEHKTGIMGWLSKDMRRDAAEKIFPHLHSALNKIVEANPVLANIKYERDDIAQVFHFLRSALRGYKPDDIDYILRKQRGEEVKTIEDNGSRHLADKHLWEGSPETFAIIEKCYLYRVENIDRLKTEPVGILIDDAPPEMRAHLALKELKKEMDSNNIDGMKKILAWVGNVDGIDANMINMVLPKGGTITNHALEWRKTYPMFESIVKLLRENGGKTSEELGYIKPIIIHNQENPLGIARKIIEMENNPKKLKDHIEKNMQGHFALKQDEVQDKDKKKTAYTVLSNKKILVCDAIYHNRMEIFTWLLKEGPAKDLPPADLENLMKYALDPGQERYEMAALLRDMAKEAILGKPGSEIQEARHQGKITLPPHDLGAAYFL